MSNLDVRIERLVIRLRGTSADVGRGVTHGLGQEILRQLAQHARTIKSQGRVELDALPLEPVTPPRAGTPTQLRTTVAHTIARAIVARLPKEHGG